MGYLPPTKGTLCSGHVTNHNLLAINFSVIKVFFGIFFYQTFTLGAKTNATNSCTPRYVFEVFNSPLQVKELGKTHVVQYFLQTVKIIQYF